MKNDVPLPPNRNFGFLFAWIFALISAYAAFRDAHALKIYGCLVASIIIGLVAITAPGLLAPLNKMWMKLGELMGKVVNPIIMGFIFFGLITPLALACRLFGRDELRLNRKNTKSFWVNRAPPGPAGDSFKNQF